MDRIKIIGGYKLNGNIYISGAKNAALPLMIASMLTENNVIIENIPDLIDVNCLLCILNAHGIKYVINKFKYYREITFFSRNIITSTAPYNLVSKMRASFWLIAPLLTRIGEAKVSLPGGCAIGTRPVNLILDGLKSLGVEISVDNGYIHAKAKNGLKGIEHTFPKTTVGGTNVLLMAASLAQGDTILKNSAREPEVVNLAECLISMGAHITGAGTSEIKISGVSSLTGTRIKVIPDRIEAGTYAMAVSIVGGDILLKGIKSKFLYSVLNILKKTGVKIICNDNGIRVTKSHDKIYPVNISTNPFPGFPTDLQAQFMGLMTKSTGKSKITETIFENRFMHVQELVRFGANIELSGQTALVTGVQTLQGTEVMATDLRASVSLIIAGLAAEGITIINRVYHLDRGFENLEKKLSVCGARIERLE